MWLAALSQAADVALLCRGPQPLLFTLNPPVSPHTAGPGVLHPFTSPPHPTLRLPDSHQFLISGEESLFPANGACFLHALNLG